jgi:hypothetical protein
MASHLPSTIELRQSIPERLGGGVVIGGSGHLDDQGRLEVRLAIKDDTGERSIRRHEGGTFEFAGVNWQVTKIVEAYVGGRPRVATLSKVE